MKIVRMGNIFGVDRGTGFAGNVWDKNGLSPSLTTMGGGDREPLIVAMRGRDPDDPSNRHSGIHTEQRLEPNMNGVSNTLTTVQKDNMVLERAILRNTRTEYGKEIRKEYETHQKEARRSEVSELQERTDGLSNTITTVQKDNLCLERINQGVSKMESEFRIRKLTPRECWRLMGFTDEDFDKAQKVVSNSQLYKQAGNSIVVPVLEAIFSQLIEK